MMMVVAFFFLFLLFHKFFSPILVQLVAVEEGGILQEGVVGFEVTISGVVGIMVVGVTAGVSSETRVSFQLDIRVLVGAV